MRMLLVGKSPVITSCHVHAHDSWELIVNLSGSGLETIGAEERAFYPGSISLCPPDTRHGKRIVDENESWQDIYLRFVDAAGAFPMKPMFLADDSNHLVENLMGMIFSLYHQKEDSERVAQKLCDVLRDVLLRRVSPCAAKSRLTEEINNYIIQNYTDCGCDVQAYMAGMNYVSDYIRRVYKREMQITPKQYLLQLRVEYAKRLLRLHTAPAYSIREVALLSGFSDSNYFCRQFKKLAGVAPGEYRKQAR